MIRRIILTTILFTISVSGMLNAQELNITGFVEGAYGGRIQDNTYIGRDYLLNEGRVQLQLSHSGDVGDFFSAVDFLADNVVDSNSGVVIREAYFRFSPGSFIDVKAGRQTLTWGTGDLVFINDLFPKDYISFFTGREDQYLKLPSDAVKIGLFSSALNLDVVIVPEFQGDLLPTGARLSHFNPLAGGTSGLNSSPVIIPEEKFSNSEIALRAYRMVNNFQVAGYFYNGFYKTPMGIDPMAGMYHPELSVYGTSLRGSAFSGVLNLEYGYYDSREEDEGLNPLIPNSSHRFLVGFDRQLWSDFNLGLQYYGERMTDFENYELSLPNGSPEFDELRNVFTARLTQRVYYQNVSLSLFTFYSPSDEDWHIRPNVSFKYTDEITLSVGGNFFGGNKAYTLFGQFEKNNNIYMRLRYYF